MNRWQRYWFDEGGRTAIAILRIAIATSVLMSLVQLADLPRLVAPAEIYRPVGIWMVFGGSPPADAVVDILWVVAFASTVAMLVGAISRAATAVSFVTSLALASLAFSGTPSWSHGYNIVFLAQLALLGGRCGDTLSVDALIRARRGLAPINVERGYQWSLRLVQFAVALMFVGACYHKLRSGGFTLAWATSDNLRHQFLARYDLANLPRPVIVDWLIDDSTRYHTAAILNMLSQASGLLAIIFVRRPVIRALAGLAFLVEGIAIDVVMSLPNPQWLPLAAVFFDWDAIFSWRRADPPPTPYSPPRRIHAFIIVFILYYLATAIVQKLDHRLNTYPFSAFQMFATMRAAPPWDEHRPYLMYGDRYEAALDPATQQYVDHAHRFVYQLTNPKKLEPRLRTILAELGKTHLRHHLAMFVAPAYPAKARFDKRPIAITGELTPAAFRTVLGTATRTTVELRPQHVDATNARLAYFAEHEPDPVELPATRVGNTFTLASPLPSRAEHVVAIIGDETWLVWSKKRK